MSALVLKALVAVVAMASVAELAAGTNYTIQWAASGNYGDWSAKNPVRVGDTVVFTYGSTHTVDELSEADFNACSFASPTSSDQSGSTAFTFDTAGTRYFACATGSHCRQGQKVAITVVTADSPAGAAPPQGSASPPQGSAEPPQGGAQRSAPPKGNSAVRMAGGAGFAVKLALGLGVGGALLSAF